MTTPLSLATAPIEVPLLAQLRTRTEPITLGLNVQGRFERFGINAQLRAQSRELHEAMNDVSTPAVDMAELEWLDAQIHRSHKEDALAYLHAYLAAATVLFRDHGVTAALSVVDISDITGGIYRYENAFIRTLAELALDRTPLPMTGALPDYSMGSPAAMLALDGLDFLSRATRARNTQTTHQEAHMAVPNATPHPAGVTVELSRDELQQLSLLLGLVSDREREIAPHGNSAAVRIEAAAAAARG